MLLTWVSLFRFVAEVYSVCSGATAKFSSNDEFYVYETLSSVFLIQCDGTALSWSNSEASCLTPTFISVPLGKDYITSLDYSLAYVEDSTEDALFASIVADTWTGLKETGLDTNLYTWHLIGSELNVSYINWDTNDPAVNAAQYCGYYESSNLKWRAKSCSPTEFYSCRAEIPNTPAPSRSPSLNPTRSPTSPQPTMSPTVSMAPSTAPTNVPTSAPTTNLALGGKGGQPVDDSGMIAAIVISMLFLIALIAFGYGYRKRQFELMEKQANDDLNVSAASKRKGQTTAMLLSEQGDLLELEFALDDEEAGMMYSEFAKSELTFEAFSFLKDCRSILLMVADRAPEKDVRNMLDSIRQKYIDSSSQMEINISSASKIAVIDNINTAYSRKTMGKLMHEDILQALGPALKETKKLILSDSWPRFKNSDEYKFRFHILYGNQLASDGVGTYVTKSDDQHHRQASARMIANVNKGMDIEVMMVNPDQQASADDGQPKVSFRYVCICDCMILDSFVRPLSRGMEK